MPLFLRAKEAPDAGKKSPKRRRAPRPKKQTDDEETDKPKRAPGRPRKNKVVEEDMGSNKPKRGRGRPRKNKDDSDDEDFSANMAKVVASLPMKKKATKGGKKDGN